MDNKKILEDISCIEKDELLKNPPKNLTKGWSLDKPRAFAIFSMLDSSVSLLISVACSRIKSSIEYFEVVLIIPFVSAI